MQHHAYVYEGALGDTAALAEDARERFGFTEEHHPDVHVREFEKFGIEESRWLIGVAALKPASGRALYIVGISSITTEAQQALLKLLEEPQQGLTFVLLVPHGTLLPTVRSRTAEYPAFEVHSAKSKTAAAFLKASGKERSDEITKMLKDDDGVKERVRAFLDALEVELYKKVGEPKARQALEDISMVRDYLRDRSPSLKMLLEHLALCLPILR